MAYSPVKDIDFSKITTSGTGGGSIDPTKQSAAGGSGIKGAQGCSYSWANSRRSKRSYRHRRRFIKKLCRKSCCC